MTSKVDKKSSGPRFESIEYNEQTGETVVNFRGMKSIVGLFETRKEAYKQGRKYIEQSLPDPD